MPAWVASYVISLANSTGWSEQFILWELPLARGYQYIHAVLVTNGAKTIESWGDLKSEWLEVKKLYGNG